MIRAWWHRLRGHDCYCDVMEGHRQVGWICRTCDAQWWGRMGWYR